MTLVLCKFCLVLIQPPPTSTLFPYTTLFRSNYVFGVEFVEVDPLSLGIETLEGETSADKAKMIENFAVDKTRTLDRKSTRLNSSHSQISYAVFCLKKKNPRASKYNDQAT